MKVFLLVIFALALPLELFFATILYSQPSNAKLKTALRQYGIYNELSKTFSKRDVKNADGGETYGNFVTKRFSPEYLQMKAEGAIDQSSDWITGKSQTQPSVNFKELKEDMAKKYPFFIKALQHQPSLQEMESYGLTVEEQQQFLIERASISEFVLNDFTFQLGDYLSGIKKVYTTLVFAVPAGALVLLLLLVLIAKFATGWHTKFKWLSASFLVAAVVGYVVIYFNNYIFAFFTTIGNLDKASYLALITPVLLATLKYLMGIYITIQNQANIVLLCLSAACIVGAILFRQKRV